MTEPPSIKTLKANRDEIAWWEICSILHDVGKLSSEFHEYRQTWWSMPKGWEKRDPHDHSWLDRDELLPKELRILFGKALVEKPACEGVLSVRAAVHEHIGAARGRLVELLQIGDRTDSRYDRNNPLLSNEQTDWTGKTGETYRSNVYGFENGGGVDGHALDWERRELYAELSKLMPRALEAGLTWENYTGIKEAIEKRFRKGMGDTTRPGNDTSLWEHVYAVATITKALHAEALTKPFHDLRLFMPFALYGVGLDRWRWCAQGDRIGDIIGRKEEIDEAFKCVRQKIEFEFPIGNRVYADDNFHVYLIGRVEGLDAGVEAWLDEQVHAAFRQKCRGDLKATSHLIRDAQSTTRIVEAIEGLRRKIAYPSNWVARAGPTANPGKEDLCPVCRRRGGGERGRCEECDDRRSRIKWRGPDETGGAEETPMLGEIADTNGRVGLVVARFGLRDWLSGQMTRSCLVTEADGIARMGKRLAKIKELKDQADEFNAWLGDNDVTDYRGMLKVFRELRRKPAKRNFGASLFGRNPVWNRDKKQFRLNDNAEDAAQTWDRDLEQMTHEDYWPDKADEDAKVLAAVCGKTPTPSTTLDTWMTTRDFFAESQAWARDLIEQRTRRWLRIDPVPDWLAHKQKSTVQVQTGSKRYGKDFLFHEGVLWAIGRGTDLPREGERLRIMGDKASENSETLIREAGGEDRAQPYLPWRTLTVSPDVLMMLLPADRAAAFTKRAAAEYRKQFGKVEGRLPLAVGNIFFPQHQPMFAVLDAAWRMIDNFRRLQEGPWMKRPFERGPELPLGDGSRDVFHNYALCAAEPADVKSAFFGSAGWMAHREDLAAGTEILERPNVYDGVVMGGAAARLNLNFSKELPPATIRRRDPIDSAKVADEMFARKREQTVGTMRLEEFERCLEIWRRLRGSGVSDQAMRNLWFALEERREAWTRAGGAEALRGLGDSLGARYLGSQWAAFREDFRSGLLVKSLRLHWSILKEKLGQ